MLEPEVVKVGKYLSVSVALIQYLTSVVLIDDNEGALVL